MLAASVTPLPIVSVPPLPPPLLSGSDTVSVFCVAVSVMLPPLVVVPSAP